MSGADLAGLAAAYTAAWNSGRPEAVAGHYAEDGQISINGGPAWQGRAGVAEMAAGFLADIPDMVLRCDGVRAGGPAEDCHAIYLWTFTGTHAGSGRAVRVEGWEAWQIGADGLIRSSRGWFDAADYSRQTC
ncbi:nuclear transport factor 2 family protein [Sandarakinorhabdus rubra]|uniref:nuclear transport factor 2 family protein n=1 Tax=Sandarakinorhabdus rubra TaxID=2672568 RepID=UPI0013DA935E|nr:nuclear transport factor 2 family protein [Sandarakinorhabdus rubra]